jgi:NADPH:quinone reductase-like Zn-dependent oxidoreductase
MKALYFERHGGVGELVFGELTTPAPGPGEVLLRVKACALNHLDLWVLGGWPGINLTLPHIGGSDVAGVVAQNGAGVSTLREGDRVIVNPGIVTVEDEWTRAGEESVSPGYQILGEQRWGGFAEYVCVPAVNIFPLPQGISFVDGCAPLLVGLTSWRMLKRRAHLKSGQTVLIVGAGGGVNSFCIQLARGLGAEVIALTRHDKVEKARKLGAVHVIDYEQNPDWSREVKKLTAGRGVDVVVDNVGEKTIQHSLRAVARGGTIVTVGNTSGHALAIDNRLLFTKQIGLIGSTMGSRADFIELLAWLRQSGNKPIIDSVIPLEQGAKGYSRLERGEQFGKVVVEVP